MLGCLSRNPDIGGKKVIGFIFIPFEVKGFQSKKAHLTFLVRDFP